MHQSVAETVRVPAALNRRRLVRVNRRESIRHVLAAVASAFQKRIHQRVPFNHRKTQIFRGRHRRPRFKGRKPLHSLRIFSRGLAALAALISLAYYLGLVRDLYFEETPDFAPRPGGARTRALVLACALGALLLGAAPLLLRGRTGGLW